MSYYDKYLKYKNKYLNLIKLYNQQGNGENFNWFLNESELNQYEEEELEEKYNNGNANIINFRDIDYTAINSDYINDSNKLSRQQKITITPDEEVLFEELKKCAQANNIILRVAGGWVRDKIIGLPNDDIDIAVEGMSGKKFSEYLFTYINSIGNNWVCDTPAIIDANAAKSKNLETAKLKLRLPNSQEFELDFVALRSEIYDEHSRVPIAVMATAQEDAYRRDFTINSLFYNINTKIIEDYVGGIRDIKRRIIRTPVNANETFRDDPLRILRALRFVARFQFDLDDEIRRTMRDAQIISLLTTKVSKERIGKELEGFFKGSSIPFLAFKEINDSGLWNHIFGGNGNWGNESIELLSRLEDKSKITTLAALTLPLATLDKDVYYERSELSLVQKFYSTNLRLSNKLLKSSEIIHKSILNILELPHDIKLWKRSDIALIKFNAEEYFINAMNIIKTNNPEIYKHILEFIKTYEINNEEIIQIKKKFEGNRVIQKFQVKNEKTLSSLLTKILIWNLNNPSGTFEDALALKDYFTK